MTVVILCISWTSDWISDLQRRGRCANSGRSLLILLHQCPRRGLDLSPQRTGLRGIGWLGRSSGKWVKESRSWGQIWGHWAGIENEDTDTAFMLRLQTTRRGPITLTNKGVAVKRYSQHPGGWIACHRFGWMSSPPLGNL